MSSQPDSRLPELGLSSHRIRRAWMVLGLLTLTFLLYLIVQTLLVQSGLPQASEAPPTFGRIPPPLLISLEFVLLMICAWLIDGVLARRRLRFGARLLMLSLSLAVIGFVLAAMVGAMFHPPQPESGSIVDVVRTRLSHGALRGVTTASLWVLGFVYPLSIERENLRVAAELAQLRSRLEPHFLLNTLNTISGLIRDDPEQTRRLISCLGDLLRDSLESNATHQTVAEEVAWLRRYAEILEIRHHGQLSFEWTLHPEAMAQVVPRALLQPIVENAVLHGALRADVPGRVRISASIDRSERSPKLVLSVADNGPGLPSGPTRKGAFGLHSVRRRLQLECPGSTLTLDGGSSGTTVTMRMPLDSPLRPVTLPAEETLP